MKNAELAYETLDYIIAHPEECDQSQWVCETGMCFAGHAAVLGGWKMEKTEDSFGEIYTGCAFKDNQRVAVWAAAEEALSICSVREHYLFDGCNGIEDLIFYIRKTFGPDPRPKGMTSEERFEKVAANS
jgi:hypothetical protein